MLDNKNRPPMSPKQKQIFFGYLMGDGYLNKTGTLTVEQGKDQLKFAEWMHEKLKPFCTKNNEVKPVFFKKEPSFLKSKKAGQIRSYRFNTQAWFKDEHSMWYLNQGLEGTTEKAKFIKRLPSNIAEFFTPLFIIVWFACDGTKPADCKGAKFEVTAFTAKERELLKTLFLQKYQIHANINRQGTSSKGTEQWALCILAEDYSKFYSLITQDPLIQDLFPYKLCQKP